MPATDDVGVKEIAERLLEFRKERDWGQFHSAKNLAISISLEAAELLEHFQWSGEKEALAPEKKEEAAKELADIFNYVILLADDLGIDIIDSAKQKIEENRKKYPIEKAKGSARKYKDL
jgi:dCTP diphosphatase